MPEFHANSRITRTYTHWDKIENIPGHITHLVSPSGNPSQTSFGDIQHVQDLWPQFVGDNRIRIIEDVHIEEFADFCNENNLKCTFSINFHDSPANIIALIQRYINAGVEIDYARFGCEQFRNAVIQGNTNAPGVLVQADFNDYIDKGNQVITAVKAAFPQIKILAQLAAINPSSAASTAYRNDWNNAITNLAESTGMIHGYALHVYTGTEQGNEEISSRIDYMRDYLDDVNLSKPIIITEGGSRLADWTEEGQEAFKAHYKELQLLIDEHNERNNNEESACGGHVLFAPRNPEITNFIQYPNGHNHNWYQLNGITPLGVLMQQYNDWIYEDEETVDPTEPTEPTEPTPPTSQTKVLKVFTRFITNSIVKEQIFFSDGTQLERTLTQGRLSDFAKRGDLKSKFF